MSNEQEPPEPGPAWAPHDPPRAGDPPGDDRGAEGGGGVPAPGSPPSPAGYGSPGGYGAAPPRSGEFGAPPGGYGPPRQPPYGGQPQDPYGGPQQGPYGMPQQGPYGMPRQDPYQQGPYAQDPYQQSPYQQGPYAAPGWAAGQAPGSTQGPGWAAAPPSPAYPPNPSYPSPSYPPERPPGRNNRPLIIGSIAGGVVLLLVVVVAVIGMSGGDRQGGATNAPTAAASNGGAASASQAAQGLGAVPALRYSGTFSSGGDDFQAQLSVTKAGSATGTIKTGGATAALVSVDGKTYLKAPKSFWRDQGGVTANPEDYAGRWARAPESAFNLDIKNVLAAGAIIQGLRGVGSSQPAAGTENVNGTPAVKVTGTDAEYYLSTANPPKLLRIAGVGTNSYQFDVAEVAPTEVAALFQQLRGEVRALDGARDPSVRFLPAAKIKTSNCGPSSCTMKLTVTTVSLGGSSRFRAVMLGRITQGGPSGRTLGTCSDRVGASSGRRINMACTVRGGAWSAWVRGIRGTAKYYVQARTVAEALDANALLSAVDQEQQGA
ncbi:MAG TPA: hypothetical protein VF069_00850 [Streptosporangiaceae bacterium]